MYSTHNGVSACAPSTTDGIRQLTLLNDDSYTSVNNDGITGIPRKQFPRSILVTSSPTRPTRAKSSRGRYEDATRKLLPWNLNLSASCEVNVDATTQLRTTTLTPVSCGHLLGPPCCEHPVRMSSPPWEQYCQYVTYSMPATTRSTCWCV